jgi:nucleolar protein 56
MRRRSLLAALCGASTGSLAGCLGSLGGSDLSPTIRAPDQVAVDDRLDLAVTGVAPAARLVVEAAATDATGAEWQSRGVFEPSGDRLELRDTAPVEGTYDAASGMGLCWSMVPGDPTRGFYDDDQSSQSLTLRVLRPDSVDGSTGPLVETTIERRLLHPDGTETELDGEVVGTLVESPGDGPAPGVLLCHGSGGNRTLGQARTLASHGFTVLALQYFSPEHSTLPDALVEVPVEYGDRAVEWLADHETTTDAPVRVGGASRGGELALLLAARHDVGAAVNWVGAALTFNGFDESGPVDAAAWTLDGEPLPYPSPAEFGTGSSPTDRYRTWLETTPDETLSGMEIPLSEIDAPILLLSAGADAVWASRFLLDRAASRLDALDDPPRYDHHSYPDAGHSIGVPFLPTWGNQPGGQFGGTRAGTVTAEADSWPRVLDYCGAGTDAGGSDSRPVRPEPFCSMPPHHGVHATEYPRS